MGKFSIMTVAVLWNHGFRINWHYYGWWGHGV
jgi:hypothetical protein